MIKLVTPAALALSLLASSSAFAGEKTVALAVKNMYCAACPHTVKSSLERVPGVVKVTVSYKDKTAIVTYDDTKCLSGKFLLKALDESWHAFLSKYLSSNLLDFWSRKMSQIKHIFPDGL